MRTWTNNEHPAEQRAEYRWIGAEKMSNPMTIRTGPTVEKHWLTVKHLDRNGNPPERFESEAVRLADGDSRMSGDDAVWKVELPAGRYYLNTLIQTGSGDNASATMLARPEIELDRDRTLVMDAREARPVSISVEGAPAFDAVHVFAHVLTPRIHFPFNLNSIDWPGGVFTAHLGPEAPDDVLISSIDAQAFDSRSNTLYALAPYWYGKLFTGSSKTYALDELAEVNRRQLAQTDGKQSKVELIPFSPGLSGTIYLVRKYGFELPSTAAVYTTANQTWWYEIFGQEKQYWLDAWHTYARPKRYAETWNSAVIHPTVDIDPSESVPPIGRNRNRIQVALDPFSDSAGNSGEATTSAGSGFTLYRNGEEVGTGESPSYGEFTVPAGRARYRLAYSATRNAGTEFSTKLDCSWTFESERIVPPDNQSWVPMPMWGFRITPDVDGHNRVPRTRHCLPLAAKPTPGSDVGKLAQPTVEISFDDGTTWTKVRVEPEGEDHWHAVVPVSDAAAYVSLRLKTKDAKGNRVAETIIRAYGIAG